MYRGVLCFYSDRFKRILNGSAKKGCRNIYEIDDCGEDKFVMFYNWINTGVASVRDQEVPLICDAQQRRRSVKLYEFASSYSIPALQNYAVDMFYRCSLNTRNIDSHEISAIWDHTPKYCKMRFIVIDLMIENYFYSIGAPNSDLFPARFLHDIKDLLVEVRKNSNKKKAIDEDWKLSEVGFCSM